MQSKQDRTLKIYYITTSIAEVILGIVVILLFASNAFLTLNLLFFFFGGTYFTACFVSKIESKNPRKEPKNHLYDPNLHFAIMFYLFFILRTTSLFYVFDSIFLFIGVFGMYVPDEKIKNEISKILLSRKLTKFLTYVQILVIPELALWTLITFSFRFFLTLIAYVVINEMFAYAVSYEHKSVWEKIMKMLKEGKKNKKYENICNFLVSMGNILSNVSLKIYPTNPLKVHMQ